MRILLDECLHERFRNSFLELECQTACHAGFAALKNGEILAAAEAAKFAVFVTVDQKLEYQ
jgi:predicted nuclease of predicted toxin-antitoxin system